MRRPLLIVSLLAAEALLSPASADCTCRSQGRDYDLGQSVCLQSPKGARIATCGMVLNNTSWQFTETPCTVSAGAGRTARAGWRGQRITITRTARKPHSPRFRAQPLDSRNGARHRQRPESPACAAFSSRLFCLSPAPRRRSAANWFELNFGLSGPRYDAARAAVRRPRRARADLTPSSPTRKASSGIRTSKSSASIASARSRSVRGPRRRSRAGSAAASRASPTARAGRSTTRSTRTRSWLGVGWGVEWCVVGLDRNWAYNPACRMARP